MAVKASAATHTAIIITYSGWPSHSIHVVTGSRNSATSTTKAVEDTASDISEVEYTSMGSFQRS